MRLCSNALMAHFCSVKQGQFRFSAAIILVLFIFITLVSRIIWTPISSSATNIITKHVAKELEKTFMLNLTLSYIDQNIKYKDFNYLDPKSINYERRLYSHNIEILFRFPKTVQIRSLLLIFHGCGRSQYEWFNTIERQRIIGAAIDLGYGCLVFQATSTSTKCWSPYFDLSQNDDAQMVLEGLKQFYNEYPKLKSLPLFTFGASSGGIFSSIFALNQQYKIQGQIIFISIILPAVLNTYVKKDKYPPTAWIYMPRDTEFASEERINASIQVFMREHIPYVSYRIGPISLTKTTFHDRIPKLSLDTSIYIFYRLKQNSWLDSQNYLIHNPRENYQWETFLFQNTSTSKEVIDIYKNLEENRIFLAEFLNTAYGVHEINFQYSFEALQWLKNIYTDRSNSLSQR